MPRGIVEFHHGFSTTFFCLKFSDEAVPLAAHPDALNYSIFSFILDFGEIIKDYVAEDREKQSGASA